MTKIKFISGCILNILFLCSSQNLLAKSSNLMEVYQLAQCSDPLLRAAQADYRAQKEAVPQALANFLPVLNAQGSLVPASSGIAFNLSNVQTYTLNLAQPLFHAEFFSQLSQAKQTKQRALFALLAADQDLMIRTADRYFAILGATDVLVFTKAKKSAFFREWEQARHRFEVGLIAITDVHEAKAEYDNATAQEIAAQNILRNQYEKLREITGVPVEAVQGIAPDYKLPLSPPNPADQESWVNSAHCHNLETKIAQATTKIAKADIGKQVAGHLPTVDLTAQTGYAKQLVVAGGDFLHSDNITISATLPLFQGGAVLSRTRQAQAYYCEALDTLDKQRRTVDSETRQRYRGVLTAISEITALAQSVVSNKSALESVRAGYEAGTRTIVDVLNAESNVLSAERDYALSQYNYLLEGLQLKRAVGTLEVADLCSVNALIVKSRG